MTQLIPFLDSLALIQGLIIGILIIVFGKGKTAPLLFGLFVITYAVELSDSIITDWGYADKYPKLRVLPLNFYFLNLPLLYLYLESIVGKLDWKKHFWWLLPGILEFASLSALTISGKQPDRIRSILEHYSYSTLIFYFLVSLFIIFKVINYQKLILDNHSNLENRNLNWVKYICIFFCIYVSLFAFEVNSNNQVFYPILSAINVVFIYVIGILGLKQKYVDLSTLVKNEQEPIATTFTKEKLPTLTASKKSSSPPLQTISTDDHRDKFERIDAQIRSERYYQNSDLSLNTLSSYLQLPARTVSQAINSGAGMNFNKYINKLRVEFATTLLKDSKFDHLSMSGIATEAGFNSRSTFYAAFKSNFGVNPTKYKAHNSK